jgi:glycosyltransferase involved in cell wall biosynthesis
VLVSLPLLTLVPGISGGSETYVRELCRALARVGEHEYDALVPTLAPDVADGLATTVATGYRASATIPGRLLAMGGATLRPGRLREHVGRADVVHYPLTVPIPGTGRPTVLTLLDVQHLDLPELFPRGERLFRRLAYDRAAHGVIERLGLAPDRVHAIHLGVDHERFTPDPAVARESFIYYPARPWPHKNHERLFAALAALRSERPDLRLVLTGAGHDRTALPDGVETLGDAPLGERISLYRRAAAVVFPSLYEGFGLPPIEAMACGCPVAASRAASLPEVVGDAAVLFDPYEPESIAAGIVEALDRATELATLGLERAAFFTWDATARAHDRVYDVAAGA